MFKSGIIIDPTMFHMGWTYEIKSSYVNVEDAVCVKHRNYIVEFAVKGDDDMYDILKLTPEIIGSCNYRFTHKTVPNVDISKIKYRKEVIKNV